MICAPCNLETIINPFSTFCLFRYVFIAHNSAGFDSILLLRSLLARQLRVEPIFEGSRLIMLKIPKLRLSFIDSYKFINIPLDKFPERFPDDVQSEKGCFPFSFATEDHFSYEGPVPDETFFWDKFTTEKKKAKIKEFREAFQKEGKPWVFHEQIHKYLLQDVRMLRDGCLAYQKEIFDFQESLSRKPKENLFHPFTGFFTASSLGHALFRYIETL